MLLDLGSTPKSSKRNPLIRNVAPQKPRFLSLFGLPHGSNFGFLRSLAWPGLALAWPALALAWPALALAWPGRPWPGLAGLAWPGRPGLGLALRGTGLAWPGLTKKPAQMTLGFLIHF